MYVQCVERKYFSVYISCLSVYLVDWNGTFSEHAMTQLGKRESVGRADVDRQADVVRLV